MLHVARRPLVQAGTDEAFEQLRRDHERLLELHRSWGLDEDPAAVAAIHRQHLRGIIACIEGAVGATGGARFTHDRYELVRSIVNDPATQESIVAVRSSSRDFGLMYGPIARRNAAACCMGAHLRGIVERVTMPFAAAAAHR